MRAQTLQFESSTLNKWLTSVEVGAVFYFAIPISHHREQKQPINGCIPQNANNKTQWAQCKFLAISFTLNVDINEAAKVMCSEFATK